MNKENKLLTGSALSLGLSLYLIIKSTQIEYSPNVNIMNNRIDSLNSRIENLMHEKKILKKYESIYNNQVTISETIYSHIEDELKQNNDSVSKIESRDDYTTPDKDYLKGLYLGGAALFGFATTIMALKSSEEGSNDTRKEKQVQR